MRPKSEESSACFCLIRSTLNTLQFNSEKSIILRKDMHSWDRRPSDLWGYVFLLAIIYILFILRDYIRSVVLAFTLDGPKAVPIFGNANALLEDNLLHRMATEAKDYGRVFRIWLTILPYVVVKEPRDIQAVLGSIKHTRKISMYKLLDNFLGKGLITRDVETWKVHRKILQPAFHLHVLERFCKTFAERANRLGEDFSRRIGENVNVAPLINDSVYDILSETVLGITPTKRKDGTSNMDDMPFRKGQVMVPYRITRPWLLIEWIYRLTKEGREEQQQRNDLFNACQKMMNERRDFLKKNGSIIADTEQNERRKVCLLEYMVEMNEKNPCFTDEDIVEECCTFMLAGQDSVGSASAITLFLLANHPEWQDKCVEELNEIFGSDKRPPTMNDLKAMKCIEMCIKEALRLYPSVPVFGRILGEDVKMGKHVLPAGCGVFIVPYSTHRLPHHFPNPHTFMPERFSAENSEKRHSYAYLPFSAGPRNCIGYKFAMLEMKSMISAVLRRCQLQSVPGKEQVRPKFRMTVRAQGGLWVKVEKRKDY